MCAVVQANRFTFRAQTSRRGREGAQLEGGEGEKRHPRERVTEAARIEVVVRLKRSKGNGALTARLTCDTETRGLRRDGTASRGEVLGASTRVRHPESVITYRRQVQRPRKLKPVCDMNRTRSECYVR